MDGPARAGASVIAALTRRHGGDLALFHYVVDIGPQSHGPTNRIIRDNFLEKFGESFLVPSENEAELAFGRVFENFSPVSRVGRICWDSMRSSRR